jgi:hypothetical protein
MNIRISPGMQTTLLVIAICIAWAVVDWTLTVDACDPILYELARVK